MKASKPRLTGANDPRALALAPLCTLSGTHAYDKLDRLLRRISPKRLQRTLDLVDTIRFFGGRIELVHPADYEPELDEEEEATANNGTLGTYSHWDSWVTIPLDQHKGWGSVEETVRHEMIHLLQDVSYKGERVNDRELPLLSDSLRWGDWLAKLCREWAVELELPLAEVEAHTLDTWVETVSDYAREVKQRTNLWEGTWYCLLEVNEG